ncbi:hypothetical protein WN51_14158 [Melipona quadrifasciata]|uniref:Uncharacterized protein n=1 Tax=Melipona quadrifasciata TaxID=166423 RepID=A0A0N0U526_9HYME|nr:hypothetical protein WN51_14158 [Melipona quadrifasciata]
MRAPTSLAGSYNASIWGKQSLPSAPPLMSQAVTPTTSLAGSYNASIWANLMTSDVVNPTTKGIKGNALQRCD